MRHMNFTFEEISQVFRLPLDQAAKQLGICTTALKKQCRKLGIPKWPYRRLRSVDRLIKELEETLEHKPEGAERKQLLLELNFLQTQRALAMSKPQMQHNSPSSRSNVIALHPNTTNTISKKRSSSNRLTNIIRYDSKTQSHPAQSYYSQRPDTALAQYAYSNATPELNYSPDYTMHTMNTNQPFQSGKISPPVVMHSSSSHLQPYTLGHRQQPILTESKKEEENCLLAWDDDAASSSSSSAKFHTLEPKINLHPL